MVSEAIIGTGCLVTTNDDKFGYFQKTIYVEGLDRCPLDEIQKIEKGSVGIVIEIENKHAKVLWNIDNQGMMLYMSLFDLELISD